jgi:hypothetical protein
MQAARSCHHCYMGKRCLRTRQVVCANRSTLSRINGWFQLNLSTLLVAAEDERPERKYQSLDPQ